MFTEIYPFDSYADALATFEGPYDAHRECSPEIDWAVGKKIRIGPNGSRHIPLEQQLNPPSVNPLGSTKLHDGNGYKVCYYP